MRGHRKSLSVFAAATAAVLCLGLGGCTGSGSSDDPMPNGKAHEGNINTGPEKGSDLAATEFGSTWRDAVDTAMGSFDGDLTEVSLDWYKESYAYTVELVSDTQEYKTHIEADTGDLIDDRGSSIDPDDATEKLAEAIDLDKIVSWKEALATALAEQDGPVNEWKLEGTKHGPQWQFDIDVGSGEDHEVTVNAQSGELVTTD